MPQAEFAAFHRELFDKYYAFTERLLATGLIWPALEHCLKCSHLFNVLDASNSIGVTERTAYILRVRQLAVGIA
jgi:glycyl-tRNA synthetase alpha chain